MMGNSVGRRASIGSPQPVESTVQQTAWAVRLPCGEPLTEGIAAAIGGLRLVSGIRVHVSSDALWLTGEQLDDRLSTDLRSIPDGERYLVRDDRQLTAWDQTVPCATLPDGIWQPLAEWLTVRLPPASFAAQVTERVPLRLVRSEEPAESNLLRTTWRDWRDYATAAPQVRLNQWSFAVSDHEVLIRGLPLPPLPGQRLVERVGVAVPAGFRADPPLDAELLHQALRLLPGEIAIMLETGGMQVVGESDFVRATRSAVRLTDESLRNPREAADELSGGATGNANGELTGNGGRDG